MASTPVKTDFRPDIGGFAFNNTWTFEEAEKDEIWSAFFEYATLAVLAIPFPLIPLPPDPISRLPLILVAKDMVQQTLSHTYGLCGGMAYAALDYHKSSLLLDRGFKENTPDHSTLQGGKIRDYIWKRLLDSMVSGGVALKTIEWMFVLNALSRPDILLENSKIEWVALKKHIDAGSPWPLCLIGTTGSPFHNHQTLAYGYTENGNGTGTIFMYDNGHPGEEATIELDFTGSKLVAKESHPSGTRGPLQGFFCSDYQPVFPPVLPVSVGLLQNIAAAEAQGGQVVDVRFTATNAGLGPTPPLQLFVSGLRTTVTFIGDALVPSKETQGTSFSSDEAERGTSITIEAEGTLPATLGQQLQSNAPGAQPDPNPTPQKHYSWQTVLFVSPSEPIAPLASLFNAVAPHDPAPTNVVSRTLGSPVRISVPNNTPTNQTFWSFSAYASLKSTFLSPDGKDVIVHKLLPSGLVKHGKEGKEKEKEKEKEGKEGKDKEKEKEVSKDRKDIKEALTDKVTKDTDSIVTQSLNDTTTLQQDESSAEESANAEAFIRPDERPDVGVQTLREVSQRQSEREE